MVATPSQLHGIFLFDNEKPADIFGSLQGRPLVFNDVVILSDTYIDVSSQGRIDRLLHHFCNIVSHGLLQIQCLIQHCYR